MQDRLRELNEVFKDIREGKKEGTKNVQNIKCKINRFFN